MSDPTHQDPIPGELLPASKPLTINAGRPTITLSVANTGDRPIQIGSHYHFFEVNRALAFDREAAYGMRLDIPSGNATRFEPGETRPVTLIPLGGAREVWGCNALVQGRLDAPGAREAALERARSRGFLFEVPADGGAQPRESNADA